MDKTYLNDEDLNDVDGGTVIPYKIQPGDTLGAVANKFHVSLEQLIRWNNIQNPNLVTVGQQLKIYY